MDKLKWPLKSSDEIIKLFKIQLENENEEPDLALLSLVVGLYENSLCCNNITTLNFPIIQQDQVDTLYKKFQSIIAIAEPIPLQSNKSKTRSTPSISQETKKYATREIIKKVSDLIWNSLLRSTYKDRAHLQSLYSYLSLNKLDCFGVAFSVVAGLQVLGYKDCHLAISEDHVWVVFGADGTENVEVTWHGKGAEDKRGQSIKSGIDTQTWLYLAGNPVICTRFTEVAAIVSAINPSLNSTSVCSEVADLQQKLLWMLYDMGHLKKYPMGLGCLGELEEAKPNPNRPSCERLYQESIKSATTYYKNHHVYPYTFKGGYYYRQEKYREAFNAWADAGDVIRLYNYSREDEEIYKEFLDIANEMIPQIMKTESSGHSGKSILRDSQVFANVIRFYDGICQWEEGSQTPILHIGWAKQMVYTMSKFDYDIRSQVIIKVAHKPEAGDDNNNKQLDKPEKLEKPEVLPEIKSPKPDSSASIGSPRSFESSMSPKSPRSNKIGNGLEFHSLPTLEELTVACGEKILNPDFLLHGGLVPFTTEPTTDEAEVALYKDVKTEEVIEIKKEIKIDKEPKIETSFSPILPSPSSVDAAPDEDTNDTNNNGKTDVYDDYESHLPKRPVISLTSQKMRGLKELLLAEKMNSNAISLQITAQSQVYVGKKSRNSINDPDIGENQRPKRSRRE